MVISGHSCCYTKALFRFSLSIFLKVFLFLCDFFECCASKGQKKVLKLIETMNELESKFAQTIK